VRILLPVLLVACQSGPPASGGGGDPADDLIAPVDFTPEPLAVSDVALTARAHHGSDQLERGRACVVADFDNDDRLDLYVGNPGDPSLWLRNVTPPGGDLAFEPQQWFAERGLMWGATAGDIDNDGDVDLFAAVGGNEGTDLDRLFRNDGQGRFTDVSEQAGILGSLSDGEPQASASAGATMVDFDADGLLDIWVNVNAVPIGLIDKDNPDDQTGRNILWRNQGDGTFSDHTFTAGLTSKAGTRHSSWLDYDNDGDLDLYENNFKERNALWRNMLRETGEATFEAVTLEMSLGITDLGFPRSSFSSTTADFNQDGWEDIFVFSRGWPASGPHLDGHALFLNAAGKGFVELSAEAGFNAFFDPFLVAGQGASDCGDVEKSDDRELDVLRRGVMGSSIADLNLDGLPDIAVGNGGPQGGMFNQLFLSTGMVQVDFESGSIMVPQYLDGSRWTDFPAAQDPELPAYVGYPYKTHGICMADFDDDGTTEMYVVNGGPQKGIDAEEREPNRMFVFDFGTRQHLKVLPIGDGVNVNRSGIGTRVDATLRRQDGTTWTVTERLRGSNGFSAQHGPELMLGLADAIAVDRLVVSWPDGTESVLTDVSPNQRVVVER
jgi:hypothetical protein